MNVPSLECPIVAEEVAGGADLLVRVADVHAGHVAVHRRHAVQEDEQPEDGGDHELRKVFYNRQFKK